MWRDQYHSNNVKMCGDLPKNGGKNSNEAIWLLMSKENSHVVVVHSFVKKRTIEYMTHNTLEVQKLLIFIFKKVKYIP